MDSSAAPLAILKARFGYDSFRALQEEIIGNVLGRRDSLALLPTGGGKSLCYQLPALIFDGITLVISPLIALMKDQVDALNANGIAARFINSSLAASEIEDVQAQVRRGQVKILYVAPERLVLSQLGFSICLRKRTIRLSCLVGSVVGGGGSDGPGQVRSAVGAGTTGRTPASDSGWETPGPSHRQGPDSPQERRRLASAPSG